MRNAGEGFGIIPFEILLLKGSRRDKYSLSVWARMVRTLSLSPEESLSILRELENYPSLPAPSSYEKARHGVGECIVTVYTSGKIVIQGKNVLLEKEVEKTILSWLGAQAPDQLILGLDETGRGERTGPLVVGGVLGYRNKLRGVRDSKKQKNHSLAYREVTRESLIQISVSLNAETIDVLRKKKVDLNRMEAVIAKHIHLLTQELFPESMTIMDGKPLARNLRGIVFLEKADDLEPCVSAASIVAKHIRTESGDANERKTWKKTSQTPR